MWKKLSFNLLSATSQAASVFFSATTVVTNYLASSFGSMSYIAAATHGVICLLAKSLPAVSSRETAGHLPKPGSLMKLSHGVLIFGNMLVTWFMIASLAEYWWLNVVALPFLWGVAKTYKDYNLGKSTMNAIQFKQLLKYRTTLNKKSFLMMCMVSPFALFFRASLTFWFFNEAFFKLFKTLLVDSFGLTIDINALRLASKVVSGCYSLVYGANYIFTKVYSFYEYLAYGERIWPKIKAAHPMRKTCGVGVMLLLLGVEIPATNFGYAMAMLYVLKELHVLKRYSSTAKIVTAIFAIPATGHDITFYMRDALERSILSKPREILISPNMRSFSSLSIQDSEYEAEADSNVTNNGDAETETLLARSRSDAVVKSYVSAGLHC